MNCPRCNKTIDEHEAGRCIDAWIRDAVFDNKVEAINFGTDFIWLGGRVKDYSTSIADAWEVVEKMLEMKLGIAIKHGWVGKEWVCLLMPEYNDESKDIELTAPTAPLAICRAALKAREA